MLAVDPFVCFLPGLPGGPADIQESIRLVECMQAHGVHRAIHLSCDPTGGARIPECLIRKKIAVHLWQNATQNRFRRFLWQSTVTVPLHAVEDLSQYFPELTIGESRLLPISLPRGHFSVQEEHTYAHLLSMGVKPLLIWDEPSLTFWSQKDIDRICSLPQTIHLLRFSFFAHFPNRYLIEKLIATDAPVVLGSGCGSADVYPAMTQIVPVPEMRMAFAYMKRLSSAVLSHGFF